jgi:hypothetical protein
MEENILKDYFQIFYTYTLFFYPNENPDLRISLKNE